MLVILLTVGCALLSGADGHDSWTAQEARELPTFHDASLAVVLETGGYNSTLAPHGAPPSSLPALFSVEPATPACALDVKDAMPSNTAACGSAVTAPFAAMPLCVVYNITGVPGELALNATEAARLFGLGTGATRAGLRLATTGDETAVADAQSVEVVVAVSSHTFTAFRRRLAGLTGDASISAAMGPGSTSLSVADGAAVVAALRVRGGLGRVAVLPAPLATAAGLPCAAFRRETTAGRRTVWTALRATLQPSDARRISVTATDAIGSSDDGSVYPFLEPLFATASVECGASRSRHYAARLLARFGDAAFSAHLARWGIVLRPALEMAAVAGLWAQVLCDPPKRVVATGSSAVAPLLTQLALGHLGPAAPLVDYAGVSSGTGLRAVAASTAFFAASESTYTDADFATHPTVQFFPAVALAMAIVAALPGLSSVVVPQCLVPAMFNGTVASWRDPRLVAANPFVLLPDVAVTVAVRAGSSGSTTILTSGLAAIERQCWGGSTFAPSETWSASLPPGSVKATDTSALLQSVSSTAGMIGYVDHGTAVAEGALELQIKGESGITVGPSSKAVQVALDAATVDHRRRVTLDVVPGAYPFAGVAYFVIDGDLPAAPNCSRYRDSLLFMRELLSGTAARAAALSLNYVPLPSTMAEVIAAGFDGVKCGGVSLLRPPHSTSDLTVTIAVTVAIGISIIVAVVAVMCIYVGLLRHRECPSDADQPFVAFFVSTKNEEELLEAHGDGALPIFRDLRAIVRTAAGRHGCHVARSLDAHHLVVAKTVEAALFAATEIVDTTYRRPLRQRRATDAASNRRSLAAMSFSSTEDGGQGCESTLDVAVGFAFEHGTIDRTAPDCFAAYGGAAVANAAAFADTAAPGSVVVQACAVPHSSDEEEGADSGSRFGRFGAERSVLVGAGKHRRMERVQTLHMYDSVRRARNVLDKFGSEPTASVTSVERDAPTSLLTALESAAAVAVRRVVVVALEVPSLCVFDGEEKNATAIAAAVHEQVAAVASKYRATFLSATDGRFAVVLGLERAAPKQLTKAVTMAFALHHAVASIPDIGPVHAAVASGRAAVGRPAPTECAVVAGAVATKASLLASVAKRCGVPIVCTTALLAELPPRRSVTVDVVHWPGAPFAGGSTIDELDELRCIETVAALVGDAAEGHGDWMYESDHRTQNERFLDQLLALGPGDLPTVAELPPATGPMETATRHALVRLIAGVQRSGDAQEWWCGVVTAARERTIECTSLFS